MTIADIHTADLDGEYTLFFPIDSFPVDLFDQVKELGYSLNGYFFEGFSDFLAEDKGIDTEDIDYDPEAELFQAVGPEDGIGKLKQAYVEAFADADRFLDTVRRAIGAGYELED